MNLKEIRWKQRFANFEKAYFQFKSAVEHINELSDLEKEGLIQRFEYTFELAWKTLKDYLEAQDVPASFPREVIKTAFQYELIEDGEAWMDMLEKRNLMAHTYDREKFDQALKLIHSAYYHAISQVYFTLGAKK